jgi:xylulokinase
LLLEDYLLYRLTGDFNCSKSLYSSTLYLDIVKGEYWVEMLEFIGIDKSYLPTLKESGEKVGEFNGAIVSMGALDQIAGFTGSGINKEGVVSEMTGTCLAVCALTTKLPPYYEGIKVPCYYVEKGKYCLLMFAPTAGMVMEWYRKNFYLNESYKVIDGEAGSVPLGSEGLTIAPNMCGEVMPINDANLKGGVYGIELKHTRGHFARAIMESVACLLRQYLDYIGIEVDEVISIGGGSRSKLWLQIKADIVKKKICTLKNKETGCLGSAIYAGIGAGVYSDRDSAIQALIKIDSEVLPSANSDIADKLYDKFLSLDKMLINRDKTLN